MTNSINAPIGSGLPGKTAGRLSMISMLAISVGMAAAPAHSQDMAAPDMAAPLPASSPLMAPTVASPQAGTPPALKADATPTVTADRADDLARKGGFDPETVAPEALAQIESEQQARKAAAATAAAASAKPPVKAPVSAANGAANGAATSRAGRAPVAREPMSYPVASSSADLATGASGPVVAIPNFETVPPDIVASPEAFADGSDTNWGVLAGLAALLGVGGAGAYAMGRRRKSKGQAAAEIHRAEVHSRDPFPAAMNEAIMPELRRDPVEPEIRPTVEAEQATAQPIKGKVSTKVAFANFVANLPEFEAPSGKDDRSTTIGELRVAAAPKPYLGEADLSRPEGYFMANVDATPTRQNPFLTRQNRLKRARALDAKLAEMKASIGKARVKMDREMDTPRPLERALT